MQRRIFDKIRQIVYDRSGIVLNPGKEALVSARIGKRIRALGLDNHAQYLEYVTADRDEMEIVYLIDAISTNVTSFYREADHFPIRTMHCSRNTRRKPSTSSRQRAKDGAFSTTQGLPLPNRWWKR